MKAVSLRHFTIVSYLFYASCTQTPKPEGLLRLRTFSQTKEVTCIKPIVIRRGVKNMLGYSPFRGSAKRIIEIQWKVDGDVIRAQIRLIDDHGKATGIRYLQAYRHECQDLSQALVLAISLAIDPLVVTLRAEKNASLSKQPAIKHASSKKDMLPKNRGTGKSSPPPETRAKHPGLFAKSHMGVKVGGAITVGSSPSVAFGLRLQTVLRWPIISFALEGQVDFPSTLEVPGGHIQSFLAGGSLLGCGHFRRFFGCGEFALAAIWGAGKELSQARHTILPYSAAGLRGGVEVLFFKGLSLQLYTKALFTITRAALTDSVTEAEFWSTSPVAGTFGLACGW